MYRLNPLQVRGQARTPLYPCQCPGEMTVDLTRDAVERVSGRRLRDM